MRCSKAGKYLSTYIDGELGEGKTTLLETHLAQCNRCAGELDELKRLHDLFSQAERFPAPSGFRAEVVARINRQPARNFSLFPVFIRFAETALFVLAITAGIMSGGLLINAFAPHLRGEQVVASLSLETFEALPPDSLGSAYLAMTEERR